MPDRVSDQQESDGLAAARAALYRVDPEDFVAARDERVRALKAGGAREAAAEVARLRKPTVSAWLVNQLVADEPALRGQLTELAEQLRAAQAELSGEDLRALGRQRQQLVSGLVARARELARAQGRVVHEDVLAEVESSLRAALADPDVAREVLSGQLVRAAGYAGFGPAGAGAAAPERQPARRPRASSATAREREEATARRRQEADDRLRQARRALEAAQAVQRRAESAAAKAADARAAGEQRIEWLRAQLRQAETELEEAQHAQARAAERLTEATAAAKAAAETVAEAERARAGLDER